MRVRLLPWLGVIGAGLILVASVGLLVAALGARADAQRSLENARRLHAARIDVARAQEELGGTDLSDANESAQRANRIALRVGHVTRRIVTQLTRVQETIGEINATARRGTRNTVFARRQTDVASDLLGAIGGYQEAAARLSRMTNRALERILAALRETNEQFPPELP